MSIVAGLPFRDGIAVASDKAGAPARGPLRFGVTKLGTAGGVLFSCTGQPEMIGPDGRVAFSLPHVIANAAPKRLKMHHLPSIAKAANDAMKRQLATLPTHAGRDEGCAVVFWFHDRIVSFTVPGDAVASERSFGPDSQCTRIGHGVDVSAALSQSSVALHHRRPRVREVSRAEAVAYVKDYVSAVARAAPDRVGGGVDVRIVRRDGTVSEVA